MRKASMASTPEQKAEPNTVADGAQSAREAVGREGRIPEAKLRFCPRARGDRDRPRPLWRTELLLAWILDIPSKWIP